MTVYVIRYRGRVFHQTSHRDDHHRMLELLAHHGHQIVDGVIQEREGISETLRN